MLTAIIMFEAHTATKSQLQAQSKIDQYIIDKIRKTYFLRSSALKFTDYSHKGSEKYIFPRNNK